MIKIERANLEQVLRHIRETDLPEIRENIQRAKEEFARLDKKKKAVFYMVAVVVVAVAIWAVEYKAARSISKSPSMDELLSDSKAGANNADRKEDNSKNSFVLDGVIAGAKGWKLFAGIIDDSIAQSIRTIKVPQDADSIQKAIDMAKSGDTVFVSAGEYKGNIIMKDGVSLIGESARTVILDGDKKGNVVAFKDAADINTRFENFTVKNSGNDLSGILVEDSSPIINRNIILQNDYDIYIKGESSPVVQRNTISESKSGVQIFNLEEPKNSKPAISDNLIFGNKKGVNIYKGHASIDHNTVSFNGLIGESGATFGIYLAGSSATVANNIITDNGICELCSGIYADESCHDVKIDHNDLWNSQNNFVCFGKCEMGGNNLSDDPRFTNGVQYDFSLGADSPFLSSGSDGQKLGARL